METGGINPRCKHIICAHTARHHNLPCRSPYLQPESDNVLVREGQSLFLQVQKSVHEPKKYYSTYSI